MNPAGGEDNPLRPLRVCSAAVLYIMEEKPGRKKEVVHSLPKHLNERPLRDKIIQSHNTIG